MRPSCLIAPEKAHARFGNTLIDGTEFFLRSSADGKAKFDTTMTMTQDGSSFGEARTVHILRASAFNAQRFVSARSMQHT